MREKNLPIWAFYAFLCALIVCPLEGKIIKIADGDTVTQLTSDHEKIKIRLYGIDTPEKAQLFESRAKQFTASKVGNKQVTVEEHDKDRYGRLVGIVKTGKNESLNEELIKTV